MKFPKIFLLIGITCSFSICAAQTPVLEDYYVFSIPNTWVAFKIDKSLESDNLHFYFNSTKGTGSTSVNLPWGTIDLESHADSNFFYWYELEGELLSYNCGVRNYHDPVNGYFGGVTAFQFYSIPGNKFASRFGVSGAGLAIINQDTILYADQAAGTTIGHVFMDNDCESLSSNYITSSGGGGSNSIDPYGTLLVEYTHFQDNLTASQTNFDPLSSPVNAAGFLVVNSDSQEITLFGSLSASSHISNQGVAIGNNNNFFVSGAFSGTTDLEFNGSSSEFNSESYNYSSYLASYSETGELLWKESLCNFDTIPYGSLPGNGSNSLIGDLHFIDPFIYQDLTYRGSPGFSVEIGEYDTLTGLGYILPGSNVSGVSSPLILNQYHENGTLIRSCHFSGTNYNENLWLDFISPLNDTLMLAVINFSGMDSLNFTNITGHTFSTMAVPVETPGRNSAMLFFDEEGDFKNMVIFPGDRFTDAFMWEDKLWVTGTTNNEMNIDPYGTGEIISHPNFSNTNTAFLAIYSLDPTVGIKGWEPQNITIYPNPATDQVRILGIDNMENIKRVDVINNLGQVVPVRFNKNTSSISIQDLSKGIYSVIIQAGEINYTGRFLKE